MPELPIEITFNGPVLTTGKALYITSDFHLGAPDPVSSLKREKNILNWLDQIEKDCEVLILAGDVFDFWFEYKHAVPKGQVRLMGKLADLADKGTRILYLTGNHDLWARNYLQEEAGIRVYHHPVRFTLNGKEFLVGHGDGLGPGDRGFKFLKKIFTNRFLQACYRWVHPDLGIPLARYFSSTSRSHTAEENFLGEDNEWLISYCKEILKTKRFDYFIFGHRHLRIDFELPDNARYLNLGEWFSQGNYVRFDGSHLAFLPVSTN